VSIFARRVRDKARRSEASLGSFARRRRRPRRANDAVTSVFTRDDAPRERRVGEGVPSAEMLYSTVFNTAGVAGVKRYHARHNCSRYALPSPRIVTTTTAAADVAAAAAWAAARRV